MCAIAGILKLHGSGAGAAVTRGAWPNTAPSDLHSHMHAALETMLDVQKHRGPDGEGWHVDGEAALGHRRLAVLDLSAAGRQPMTSRDGRWTIVFNGEVFNFPELRLQLPDTALRSATDTEVFLEAVAAWGIETALVRARGMFALAVWDARERELILARDRAGEKPVVYYSDGETFAFASELKALEPFHHRRLDPFAVDAYLALGYVPAPLAIFRGCAKLEAGHLLRVHAGGSRSGAAPRPQRWWYPERAPAIASGTRASRVEELREKLGEAVRLRLRSDVPVALCLSGGVDSSVVAAECVRQDAAPEAFTVRFGNAVYAADEAGDAGDADLPYARQLARRIGLRHHVLNIPGPGTPRTDLADDLARIAWHYDEPFADSSAVPSFALARAIGGRFKVVLNGDGGDEVFGGYNHYTRIGAKQALKAVAAAAGLCDGRGAGRAGIYVQSKSLFRAGERERLLDRYSPGDGFERVLGECAYPAPAAGALKRAMWTDRHLQLANGLTYKMDIALGAFGMEGRAPFLDHALMEWAQTLPDEDLVAGGEKKVLLRAAYDEALPAGILRRPKRGFGAPIGRWLAGPLHEFAAESVPSAWFDRQAQLSCSGQKKWALVMFSAWARTWRATW